MQRAALLGAVLAVMTGYGTIAGAEPHPGGTIPANLDTPLFTQCPAVGADTGCATLITINRDGTVSTATDSNQQPYDGDDDQLIGVQNNFADAICSLTFNSSVDIFSFDGDGLCEVSPSPTACPFGPTGYEGPGTSFQIVDDFNGTVVFSPCIRPGRSAYFSLEDEGFGTIAFQFVSRGVPSPALQPLPLLALGALLTVAGIVLASRVRSTGC